jgi:hypothetical protein
MMEKKLFQTKKLQIRFGVCYIYKKTLTIFMTLCSFALKPCLPCSLIITLLFSLKKLSSIRIILLAN